MRHPTLLLIATRKPWGIFTETHYLALEPADYRIVEAPEGWWVRDPAGGLVYFGAGPVRIEVSPAPF